MFGESVASNLGLPLANRTSALLPHLLSSPLGYYSDFATEDLEQLARGFQTVKFTEGQSLQKAALYFVVSGWVSIVTTNVIDGTERRVQKGAGDWVLHPSAVPESDWLHENYVWAYEHLLLDLERHSYHGVSMRDTQWGETSLGNESQGAPTVR